MTPTLDGRPELFLETLSTTADPKAFEEAFCTLPDRCREDPYRTGRMPPETASFLLSLGLAPLRDAWIVRRGRKAVGRIHANASWSRDGIGYLGFYEVDLRDPEAERIAAWLLDAGLRFLQRSGRPQVYGPIDVCTWFSYRFQLPPGPGEEPSPMLPWEPVNPPEYLEHWRRAGFSVAAGYHTKAIRYPPEAPLATAEHDLAEVTERAVGAGYTFLPFRTVADVVERAHDFYEVSLAGFADNFLFEPIPFEVCSAVLVALAKKVDFRISFWVHAPDGRPAGYAFCFVDGDAAIGKSLVVHPSHRSKALGPALFRCVVGASVPLGVTTWVSALIRDGNVSDRVTRSAESFARETWRHRYVLFSRDHEARYNPMS